MSDGQITKAQHDEVVRHIARTRFPFPDQSDWPADYVTITNETELRFPIPLGSHNVRVDIVVIDGEGRIRETGEVETEIKHERAPRLSLASQAASSIPESGVKHFFVYVPAGLEGEMRTFLEQYRISYAGLRTFEISPDGEITITPIETPGHARDHR